MEARYYEITERPGEMATREQLERLYQRYRFASKYANGGDLLEVGCGSGMGLGYLAGFASSVTGGDIDSRNIEAASNYYGNRREVKVLQLDAHKMPFDDAYYDVILLFEAIYYLERPEEFVSEARRLLKNGGHLIICTVNKSWKDFHPSKYCFKYFSVPEMSALLQSKFSNVETYGAFEVKDTGLKAKAFSLIKRTASKVNLIPGSLRARELLKKIFIGSLEPVPAEIFNGMTDYQEPMPIANGYPTDKYKILYFVAVR